MKEETLEPRGRRYGLRDLLVGAARPTLPTLYGFLAVSVVAAVEFFFSLDKGGYFPEQWRWGAAAISLALVVSTLIPGYLSMPSVGRKQWTLVGALVLLVGIEAASILWSISGVLSFYEASRTAMYVGAFVLLLPVARRWGAFVIDTTIFAALLPPAVYGLLQKIFPTVMAYTGFGTLQTDPRASSTVGYHPAFGMMCAMGALLVISRLSTFRSAPPRGLYSAVSVIFLVGLYFSFSRGGVVALASGTIVLLVLSRRRFEVVVDLAIAGLPALWIISQARGLPGLVARPVSLRVIENDGWMLVGPLLRGVLAAFVAQVLFSLLLRIMEGRIPAGVRRGAGIASAIVAAGVVAIGIGWVAAAFQGVGGVHGIKESVLAQSADQNKVAADETRRYISLHAGDRIKLWKLAGENWLQHPLTGTGADTYQIIYRYQEAKHPNYFTQDVLEPHSMWMGLLSDTGVFAFLAFAAFSVGLLAIATRNAFSSTRSRRSRALLAGSTAAATAYLISSSVDWNWFIPASTLPFFAVAAVAAGMSRRKAAQ